MTHRDTQLRDIVAVFDRYRFWCWLDAGSLLGAVRDGKLLPWDKDIDFSCWADQLPALREVSRHLRGEGYTVRPQQYRASLHKVQFRPPYRQLRQGLRTIDVSIFRREDDIAWCPVNCIQPQPKARFSVRWFLEKPVREALIQPWQRNDDRGPRRTRFPRLDMEVRTWVVPAQYFLTLRETVVEDALVEVPSNAEEYLTFRYGDWRTPVTTWNYCEDDLAMLAHAPDDALPSRR